MYKTVIVLTLAQAFARTAVPIVVLLGGIIGTQIAPTPALATLPVALIFVGTSLTTVPAALFMARFGRKAGFLLGAAYTCAAGLLAAWAVSHGNFWVFCVATLLVGSNNAFVQQYRFAAAESVPSDKIGPAISVLMLAGVAAAIIGPGVANHMRDAFSSIEFAGSFVGLSGLTLVSFVCLLFYRNSMPEEVKTEVAHRSLVEIALQPDFLTAVGAAVVGYGVMSLVMVATPVSMHNVDHISLGNTTLVIQSHIVAMFLPSLFSGLLVAKFGSRKIIAAGLAMLFMCIAIAWSDRQITNYWFALVLLGVGWNFMFVGGTTLLTQTYQPNERFKVQALNDFLIFSFQAAAALGSGAIVNALGWDWVLLLSLPWLLLLIPLMAWSGLVGRTARV